eukprot:TRINITY_DN3318_c0_g1_i3.p1 TRINITY_DN3318_c0_g1~~TRINITY_DN3318_c0_g1_i3.p1  ORF type:complete len:477 (+),score=95.46 TRINITY_DN3318_c0_g1_i3:77-1507(+)
MCIRDRLYDCKQKKLLNRISGFTQVQRISLSPKNEYLQILEKIDINSYILSILKFPQLLKIAEFKQGGFNKDNWPIMKYNDDDSLGFIFDYEEKKINCLDMKTLNKKLSFKTNLIDYFQISPNNTKNKLFIVGIAVEHNISYDKTEGSLQVFDFAQPEKPILYQPMKKAQEIILKWSSDGKYLLIQTNTFHDESNQSYYGENAVYYYNLAKNSLIKVPAYEGPIHDLCWSPDNQQFIVISGFMPSQAILFNNECKPQFDFGKNHRNTLRWSSLGRYLIIAGFGNLSGEIDIWDTIQLKKIGYCKSSSAISCTWSPDCQKFITAVLTPRLKVDNNFKVFKYNGQQIHSCNFNKTELYEVNWYSRGQYKDRPPSPQALEETKQDQQQVKKFFSVTGSDNSFAQQLRRQREQQQEGKKLDENETFNQKAEKNQNPQQEAKKKKKRIRKKDIEKLEDEKKSDPQKKDDNLESDSEGETKN